MRMSFDDYINDLKSMLAGYFILYQRFQKKSTITTPYPPGELNKEELDNLKDQLYKCVPLDNMMVDLWDWDIHFEDNLGDDWYFEAAFGAKSSIDSCIEELAEYFLKQVEECGMDYNQYEDPDFFSKSVREEAKKFIVGWRENILRNVVQWEGDKKSLSEQT